MANVLVCIKRVPDLGGEIAAHRRRAWPSTHVLGHTVSPHEECAVELADPDRQGDRRARHRADARLLGRRRAAAQRARARLHRPHARRGRRHGVRAGRRRGGDRRGGPRPRGRGHDVRPGAARQRRRRHRRLPGRHPAGLPARPAGRRRHQHDRRVAGDRVAARGEGPDGGTEMYERRAARRADRDGGRRRAAVPLDPRPHEGQEGRRRGGRPDRRPRRVRAALADAAAGRRPAR